MLNELYFYHKSRFKECTSCHRNINLCLPNLQKNNVPYVQNIWKLQTKVNMFSMSFFRQEMRQWPYSNLLCLCVKQEILDFFPATTTAFFCIHRQMYSYFTKFSHNMDNHSNIVLIWEPGLVVFICQNLDYCLITAYNILLESLFQGESDCGIL